jgi:hypothetical protein
MYKEKETLGEFVYNWAGNIGKKLEMGWVFYRVYLSVLSQETEEWTENTDPNQIS